MITLSAHPDDVALAKIEALSMGKLNRSILKGKGNCVGLLGELTAARFLLKHRRHVVRPGTHDYDLVVDGHKFDVKTARRTVDASPDYNAKVPLYQSFQNCDFYLFASVKISNGAPANITLCGWITKKNFEQVAQVIRKGEPEGLNGWICSEDCRVTPYSSLKDMGLLEGCPDGANIS